MKLLWGYMFEEILFAANEDTFIKKQIDVTKVLNLILYIQGIGIT